MKEGEKLNKESVLITPEIIEECLCESLDALDKNTQSHSKTQKSQK
jgi:hypothetical protein